MWGILAGLWLQLCYSHAAHQRLCSWIPLLDCCQCFCKVSSLSVFLVKVKECQVTPTQCEHFGYLFFNTFSSPPPLKSKSKGGIFLGGFDYVLSLLNRIKAGLVRSLRGWRLLLPSLTTWIQSWDLCDWRELWQTVLQPQHALCGICVPQRVFEQKININKTWK